MTNKEAIETIKTAIAEVEWEYPMEYAVAFDMAISSLEGKDTNVPSNDLTSRWDAIDAVGYAQDGKDAQRILEGLPSEQPSRSYIDQIKWERDIAVQQLKELGYGLGEKIRTDKDTISRQAAIDVHCELCGDRGRCNGDICPDVEVFQLLPSAQPEIIRCKDCRKHNFAHGYADGTYVGIKDCCPLIEIRGKAQGHEFDYQFCAYAERREG